MTTHTTATCDDCGWTGGPYNTPGIANYALRRHSCTKQRAKDAARLRRVRTRSKIDRTPKPCHHKNADHQHGTYATYVLDACRCRPCAHANRDYERNRTRQQAYGRWDGLIDAEPARTHVHTLMTQGMGLKRIGTASGVSSGALTKLLYGVDRPDGTRRPPAARIRPATAQALLAVTLDIAPGTTVDPTGTARRLQALACLGWSINRLATHAAIDRQALDGALTGRRVRRDTADTVNTLYDQLWSTLAPETGHREKIAAARARKRAHDNGWAPPLAWDDDTIDNPDATPNTGQADTAPGHRRVHVEDVEWLLDQEDLTWDGLTARLGVTRTTIDRALRRHNRRDLLARLTTNTRDVAA